MKISICIPTYNQGLYIEQAIRSAVGQTILPFEIIVSNDCSTDNTAEILEKLKREISNLVVINQPFNLGICRNVNACLMAANSEFIIRLDSDDYLDPSYSEVLLQKLLKYPDAGYAHAAVQEIDVNGDFLKQRFLSRKTGFQSGNEALISAINGYKVAANIVMYRKSALEAVNYITSKINFAEDYYLTSCISSKGFGNVYHDQILGFYRVWSDGKMVRQKRKIEEIKGLRAVFEEVLQPAFISRNWNMEMLLKSKSDFASRQADALSWKIYSREEKFHIQYELYKLSPAPKVKIIAWFYIQGFGIVLIQYYKWKARLIGMLKKFIH